MLNLFRNLIPRFCLILSWFNVVINICVDSSSSYFQGADNQWGNIGYDICEQCGGISDGAQNNPYPCQDHDNPVIPEAYCDTIPDGACGCPTCMDLVSTSPQECCEEYGGTWGTIPSWQNYSTLIYELFSLYVSILIFNIFFQCF